MYAGTNTRDRDGDWSIAITSFPFLISFRVALAEMAVMGRCANGSIIYRLFPPSSSLSLLSSYLSFLLQSSPSPSTSVTPPTRVAVFAALHSLVIPHYIHTHLLTCACLYYNYYCSLRLGPINFYFSLMINRHSIKLRAD